MHGNKMHGWTYSVLEQGEDGVSFQTGWKETVCFEVKVRNLNSK